MARQQMQPVKTYVHKKICVSYKNVTKWLVVFDDPRAIYFLRPEHVIIQVKNYHHKKSPDQTIPNWVDTISRISIRAEEYGLQSVYLRSKNGKTRSRLIFVITLPTSEESRLKQF